LALYLSSYTNTIYNALDVYCVKDITTETKTETFFWKFFMALFGKTYRQLGTATF